MEFINSHLCCELRVYKSTKTHAVAHRFPAEVSDICSDRVRYLKPKTSTFPGLAEHLLLVQSNPQCRLEQQSCPRWIV